MIIRCKDDECDKEEKFEHRGKAEKAGWKWNELSIDGTLYRFGYCEEHKEDHSLDFDEKFDYHDEEDIDQIKSMSTPVQNVGRNPEPSAVMDGAGGKSQSLDQF